LHWSFQIVMQCLNLYRIWIHQNLFFRYHFFGYKIGGAKEKQTLMEENNGPPWVGLNTPEHPAVALLPQHLHDLRLIGSDSRQKIVGVGGEPVPVGRGSGERPGSVPQKVMGSERLPSKNNWVGERDPATIGERCQPGRSPPEGPLHSRVPSGDRPPAAGRRRTQRLHQRRSGQYICRRRQWTG